jgi:hypothetical protein
MPEMRYPYQENLRRLGLPPTATPADVWAALEAQPDFNEGMARGKADHEAGRFVPFRNEVHTQIAYKPGFRGETPPTDDTEQPNDPVPPDDKLPEEGEEPE